MTDHQDQNTLTVPRLIIMMIVSAAIYVAAWWVFGKIQPLIIGAR
jgi:hypothetical protein